METPLPPVDARDFWYELPPDRIAQHPASPRDAARLLIYENGEIEHQIFARLGRFLRPDDTLVFNNTRVIPARMHFRKGDEGALIEVFLLNPVSPSPDVATAMQATRTCVWACTVGNLKRFKDDTVLEQSLSVNGQTVALQVTLADRATQQVRFAWDHPHVTFAELLAQIGEIPLPPYFNRPAEERDKTDYQTVYSSQDGAVAAPTAGLHFTERLMLELRELGIRQERITLHVAGGTFQPIRTANVLEHPMHSEQMILTPANIEAFMETERIVPVGTTSMRTLESLYWYGVRLQREPEASFAVAKLEPYQYGSQSLPTRREALANVLAYLRRTGQPQLAGQTEIMIVPGYPFKMCDALITNFHLAGTTLIMLVAAFVGPDWQKIYEAALANQYRFLSFGDSSLLFKA
ncbi:MAG: S-adenosylmethionine:tRNA ribosyltransferase-isomerase [Bernardetiaceae bacterium]|jgi:S-adenosylmethionine:tRNA ribosyltransferase-isomerase|nr:S-adenosylmethionine:tRNA ribosyltransferase-isomerase [Bernardetiaceae bacterium]